jgi:hypothetical protein
MMATDAAAAPTVAGEPMHVLTDELGGVFKDEVEAMLAELRGGGEQSKGGAATPEPVAAAKRARIEPSLAVRPTAAGVEEFSGVRIDEQTRVVDAATMRQRMTGRSFVRLGDVAGRARAASGGSLSTVMRSGSPVPNGSGGEWVTIGILGERRRAMSRKGDAFGSWTLVDLKGTSVGLLLFGSVLQAHASEEEGSIVALLNPQFLPPRDAKDSVSQSVSVVCLLACALAR